MIAERTKRFKWEQLEAWLFESEVTRFTNRELAEALQLTPAEASAYIVSYQDAQLNPRVNTLFVLHRTDRTAAAVWHVGYTAHDVRDVHLQFKNDVQNRIEVTLVPLIDSIVAHNPRARAQAAKTLLAMGRLIEQLVSS